MTAYCVPGLKFIGMHKKLAVLFQFHTVIRASQSVSMNGAALSKKQKDTYTFTSAEKLTNDQT